MKRGSIILLTTLIAVWLIADTVRDSFEAIRFFSSQPHQLIYVAAIAIGGGFVALGFDRLSPRAKRQFRVFALGAAAGTLTAFTGYFAFSLVSFTSLVIETGTSGWLSLALLLFGCIATYFWFEFYRALKTGVSS